MTELYLKNKLHKDMSYRYIYMNNVSTIYKQFLTQLLKTKCLYKEEKDDDTFVLKKQEILLTMIDTIEPPKPENLKSYVSYMDDLYSMIKEKRPTIKVKDQNFFTFLSKIIEKKPSKCGNIFFLNSEKEKVKINVGLILKNQSSRNVVELKNFLYILYLECCNTLYEDTQALQFYNEILDDFETNRNGDLKSDLKDLISEILPSDSKESFNNFMSDQQFSSLLDGVIKTVCPEDKIDELREEIKKTDKEEIKKTVTDLKKQLENLNIKDVLSNLKNDNIIEQVTKTMQDLKMDGVNKEDIDEAIQTITSNESILSETINNLL